MAKKRSNGPSNGSSTATLDSIDRAIIEQLQRDGRRAFTKVGAAVGLSEAATRQRVQRLLDSEVVQIVAVTNPLSLAKRRMAMIGVRASGDVRSLARMVEALDEIEYLVITAGSFDLMCEVVAADDQALLAVIDQLRGLDGVVSTETFVYLDLVKQTFEFGAH